MIDRDSDRPAFKQLADLLRARISSGELPPGSRLPSETTLSQETGLSRNTVRESARLLAAEGLVVIDPPHGTYVRDPADAETVTLGPGDTVEYHGSGTVVVKRAHGATETYGAGSVRIIGGQ